MGAPQNVDRAVLAYSVSLVLGVAQVTVHSPRAVRDLVPDVGWTGLVVIYSLIIGGLLLQAFFLYKSRHQKNWARFAIAAYTILSIVVLVPSLGEDPPPLPEGLVRVISMSAEVLATLLLFTPSSSAWFLSREQAGSGSA